MATAALPGAVAIAAIVSLFDGGIDCSCVRAVALCRDDKFEIGSMQTETVEFKSANDLSLRGIVHHPAGMARATALFAHCFTCTAQSKAAVTISRQLARRGIRVLRFDFTGLGESEGEFANTSFSSSVADLLAAARYLVERFGSADVLVGHSLGGTAVLQAALQLQDVRAVATIAAPARAEHVKRLLGDPPDDRSTFRVDVGGTPFTLRREFLTDIENQPPPTQLEKLRCALLVLHAPLDAVVDIENAAEIFGHAKHPKSFVSLDGADHLLTRSADAEYAADVIAAWASRYLPSIAEAPVSDWARAETGNTGFLTNVSIASHAFVADEPTALGGEGLGPSPTQFLCVALAACTSMTLQMYARHKGLDLQRVVTRVRHEKVKADVDGKPSQLDRFERELALFGTFDTAARDRLAEIADRCPVHKALTRESQVVTRLVEAKDS
jgi:putative redox protein